MENIFKVPAYFMLIKRYYSIIKTEKTAVNKIAKHNLQRL